MFRFLFFLLVFYLLMKGIRIFIQMFKNNFRSNNYRNNNNSKFKDKENIEEAEFTEIESEIKKEKESK